MKVISLGLLASSILMMAEAGIAKPLFNSAQVIIPVPTVNDDATLTPAPPIQPAAPVPAPLAPAAPAPLTPAAPISIPPAGDASNDLYFLTRAKNLARQAAISQNGGLGLYRPEASMYGPALQSPFTRNADGSVTFRIRGGAPGAPQLTQETEVLVSKNVQVSVVYNGASRGTAVGGGDLGGSDSFAIAAINEDSFIARARNLARQAGISANGGLRQYRPEAAMFGPTSGTPVTKNADGSLTFVFKGAAPLSQVPTQETSVTVTKAGQVSVNYNRPL